MSLNKQSHYSNNIKHVASNLWGHFLGFPKFRNIQDVEGNILVSSSTNISNPTTTYKIWSFMKKKHPGNDTYKISSHFPKILGAIHQRFTPSKKIQHLVLCKEFLLDDFLILRPPHDLASPDSIPGSWTLVLHNTQACEQPTHGGLSLRPTFDGWICVKISSLRAAFLTQ